MMTTVVNTISVLTQHNDNNRTGANLQEGVLNTSNVNPQQFGMLFKYPVEGHVYAQILYVSNMNIPNKGTHNVVYVATMRNKVYAFDADDPNQANTPLWQRSLEPSAPLPDVNIGPTYVDAHGVEHAVDPGGQPAYRDIAHEVGVLSTPVISLQHNAIYVVAFTKVGGGYAHKLHALNLTIGADLPGSPVQISGTVHGASGNISFVSNRQIQRSALLLANDTIYIAFAGYGDKDPYHGWMFAYSASTLKQVAVFNTTTNGKEGEGGIWQAGQGPAADEQGSIYFLTGNGSYIDGKDFSDCFVKLRPNLTVLDWFSPFNNALLSDNDLDVGSSGALLIPGTDLLIGGGKEGKLFLIPRNNMGHFNPNVENLPQIQDFYIIPPDDPTRPYDSAKDWRHSHHVHGGPVYWNGPNGPWIYVWPENDVLKAFALVNGRVQATPTPRAIAGFSKPALGVPASQASHPSLGGIPGTCVGMPGGMLSISANGNTPGTGIVWASHPFENNANQAVVAGIVRAYDASNLKNELWNSKINAQRDDIGNFAKFCAPTIANGKVYIASFSDFVAVYGLLNPPLPDNSDSSSTSVDSSANTNGRDNLSNPISAIIDFIKEHLPGR
jgi:hypothetical protein